MTGYHISVGYMSGGPDKDECWQILKREALGICHHWQWIAEEAIAFGMHPGTAREYSMVYKDAAEETKGTEDSTLRIVDGEKAEGHPQIMMLAGGSGESRLAKEAIRRAFCRVIMRRMHSIGIEININVA